MLVPQDLADQKLFWRGPELFLEGAFSGTLSSLHVLHLKNWGGGG